MTSQRDIDRGLDQARRELAPEPLELRAPHRWVILSDQHKGARNDADDFRQCEPAYHAALEQYLTAGATLVVLGDGEELWEERPAAVIRAYHETLRLEARFHPDRYRSVWGNHDDEWMDVTRVRRHLDPFFPGLAVTEGLRFAVTEDGAPLGELLVVHGHQGTWDSDRHRWLSRWVVRNVWRPFQRLTRVGRATPASDACLRARHDEAMYSWAIRRGVILVAGHTHRPVWSSRTHLQKLEAELAAWGAVPEAERPANWADRLAALEAVIAERAAKFPPCGDSVKTVPCYFNSGCCIFADGDITGLELEDGVLRLVKWGRAERDGPIARAVLEEAPLADVFRQLAVARRSADDRALAPLSATPQVGPMTGPFTITASLPVDPKPRDDELDLFGLTHPGKVRARNQDHFMICTVHRQLVVHGSSLPDTNAFPLRGDRLASVVVVADGVGGAAAGEEASQIAVETIARYLTGAMECFDGASPAHEETFLAALQGAALEAHAAVLALAAERPTSRGMATTLTLVIGAWPSAYVVQVGDSRCYYYRAGQLHQVTRDQTVAQTLVDAGALRQSQAHHSPFSNVLASAIGGIRAEPVVSRLLMRRDAVFLVCSDGLTKHVTDARIAAVLGSMRSAEQACTDLLHFALDGGGTDNVTIVVGRVRPA